MNRLFKQKILFLVFTLIMVSCYKSTDNKADSINNDKNSTNKVFCWNDVDCEDITPPACKQAKCDLQTNTCIFLPDFEQQNKPCNDNNPCTLKDYCDNGICTHREEKNCDDGNPCTSDSCDPLTGLCIHNSVPNGTKCDDHNPCTYKDTCKNGTCSGIPQGCICSTDQDCAIYKDINLCTPTLICSPDSHQCIPDPDTSVQCDESPLPCHKNICNPQTGNCEDIILQDNTPCDDHDPCTTNTTCQSGKCIGIPRCNDHNPCTKDLCDPFTGKCTFDPAPLNNQPCDNGICSDGTCIQNTSDISEGLNDAYEVDDTITTSDTNSDTTPSNDISTDLKDSTTQSDIDLDSTSKDLTADDIFNDNPDQETLDITNDTPEDRLQNQDISNNSDLDVNDSSK